MKVKGGMIALYNYVTKINANREKSYSDCYLEMDISLL